MRSIPQPIKATDSLWTHLGRRSLTIIFVRNGLVNYLANSGGVVDDRQSTIPVRCFTIEQVDEFVAYIDTKLLAHHSLTGLSAEQRDQITSCFYELLGNVEQHAAISWVAVCGQYFPSKRKLIFTMIDLGSGFLPGIQAYTSSVESTPIETAREAISWALQGGSTKKEARGGSGLQGILKYCMDTKSSMHLATGGCYFKYDSSKEQAVVYEEVTDPMPGTLIHLLFRIF